MIDEERFEAASGKHPMVVVTLSHAFEAAASGEYDMLAAILKGESADVAMRDALGATWLHGFLDALYIAGEDASLATDILRLAIADMEAGGAKSGEGHVVLLGQFRAARDRARGRAS